MKKKDEENRTKKKEKDNRTKTTERIKEEGNRENRKQEDDATKKTRRRKQNEYIRKKWKKTHQEAGSRYMTEFIRKEDE